MIKISRLADYAVVILASMSRNPEAVITAGAIAQQSRLPEPTVSKILKMLTKENLVVSIRGACGGYSLAGPAAAITIADIIMALDGPIALTACVEKGDESCDYACHCPVKGRWDEVNAAIRGALEGITLADMMNVKTDNPVFAAIKKEDTERYEHL